MKLQNVIMFVGLAAAVGLGVLALEMVASSSDSASSPSKTGANNDNTGGAVVPTRAGADGYASRDIASGALRVHSKSDEVSAEELEWDELTADERVSQLRDDFSAAVRALEGGDRSQAVISRAEGALTNLRAEMYATTTGRRAHEKLEERLTSLVEAPTGEGSP